MFTLKHFLDCLGFFAGGTAFIAVAIAMSWEYWVVRSDRGGVYRGLDGVATTNARMVAPLFAMIGGGLIIWSLSVQPILSIVLLVATYFAARKIIKKALTVTRQRHPISPN